MNDAQPVCPMAGGVRIKVRRDGTLHWRC
jgi:hypothetical protein